MSCAVRITDGRSVLWRYDTGVQIQLLGCEHATECHFVVPGGVIRREVADGLCDVPDAALTQAGILSIYAFERRADGGVTRHEVRLIVNDRPKPADYVDLPDEVENLEELARRVAQLIGPGEGGGGLPGEDCKDGGYYTPTVTQPDATTMRIAYTPSEADMPGVAPVDVELPKGEKGDKGDPGKDATVTKDSVTSALGYTPADQREVDELAEEIAIVSNKFFSGAPYVLTPDRVESGTLENGTGIAVPNHLRVRTIDFISMEAGGTVTCDRNMNVFEYNSATHEYIRDNGAWCRFYTVQYACVIKIIWNANEVTPEYAAEHTQFAGLASNDSLKVEYLPEIPERLIMWEEELPAYYTQDNYLPDKAERINTLGKSADDVFLIITDMHWEKNAQKSPFVIKNLSENCHIPRMFNLGDMADTVRRDLADIMESHFDGDIHYVMGNHDYFTPATGRELAYVYDIGKPMQDGVWDRHYYYVDNHQNKLRYIVLSSFDEGVKGGASWTRGNEEAQLAWLTDEALNVETGWKVLVFMHTTHAISTDKANVTADVYAAPVLKLLDEHNTDDKVIAIFSGHAHIDAVEHTTGGIPIIITACDKYQAYVSGETVDFIADNRVKGTITEQCFDVAVLDKEARTITLVRIGAPAHDIVDGVNSGSTLQERIVTY